MWKRVALVVLVAVVTIVGVLLRRYVASISSSAPRAPNEATGQVWEIAYRGGGVRYVTHQERWILDWALTIEPIIIVFAVALVLLFMWRSGGAQKKNL